MTEARDTLERCEACDAGPGCADCDWCEGTGAVEAIQNARWRKFKAKMRKESSSYNFVGAAIADVLNRLAASERPGALKLYVEGNDLLAKWEAAESLTEARTKATSELLAFNRRALDFLVPTTERPPE
jgi:hypothetical protein